MSEKRNKEIKSIAKMAKKRLKNGFWENVSENVQKQVTIAEEEGENVSGVIKYYKEKVTRVIVGENEEIESLYLRVKYILDTFGDVSDILGRLCDKEYMQTLSFSQKQRYLFELAKKYRICRERYEKEKKPV